ncbi:MAG: hypothetical protein H3C51_04600 [Rubellimicrobium sp.]|nr:hypothetical protein [Rubellimicrobium sp.]
MAEKAMWPNTLCVALTYSDETEQGRDGARMFAYADVRAFLKRLAQACRRADPSARVRFLCAGEQGDRYGRCHWHLILYSDLDLTRIGTFRGRYGAVAARADMMTVGKRKRRLNWSLWPFGFVTLQEPDEGGMAYVLSYCLKDQFTGEKSRGTMREAKAENFATGLFRMSKRPPIGETWLMRKLEALDATHSVLPSTKLKVPGLSGYYHPNGRFRETLLWGLVALNKRAEWATGAPAPQWPALLASCADNESDMEILNGPATPPEDDPEHPDYERQETRFANRARQDAAEYERRAFARRCGSSLPCRDCLHNLGDDDLAALQVRRLWPTDGGAWEYVATDGAPSVEDRQRDGRGGSNPHCSARGTKLSRLVFPNSDPAGPFDATRGGNPA